MGMRAVISKEVVLKRIRDLDIPGDSLARKVGVKPEHLKAWLESAQKPTYKQAKRLARALKIPFAYLIAGLPREPMTVPIPDLRTAPSPLSLSDDAKEVIRDAQGKVEWLRDRRLREGREVLAFVGSCGSDQPPKEIARIIKDTIDFSKAREARSPEDYLREAVRSIEESGIIVLRSSVVANNNFRKLDPSEFRGFAIADRVAPLVFVNAGDELKAQIFTLFHELAHIWLGQSGISDVVDTERNRLEYLCNEVAAEILMPEKEFLKNWDIRKIEKLSEHFKASVYAVLVRALRLKLIDKSRFEELYSCFYSSYERHRRGEGGDFYNTLLVRQSHTFTMEVLSAVRSGEMLYRDAARMLNVSISTVDRLLRRLMVAGKTEVLP